MNAPFEHLAAPFGHDHGPMLTGPFAPVLQEEVLTDLPVMGKIPTDLNGVYLRNGPNPRFKPKGLYHPFDGDGMIHAAQFKNGQLTYRNKWVRTEGWLENEKQGKETHWGIHSTLKGRDDRPMADSANTDIIGHNGKAVATWYLAGKAHLIDPITLETTEAADYGAHGDGQGVSAHPKVDETTGEMMFFDYFDHAPFMAYGVVDKSGKVVHHVPIELPGNRLPHDMGMSENYSILHDLPVYHDEAALAAGRHKIRFNASMKARFGVIPRYGKSNEIKWFEFSPCFMYHVINCWEEGDEVVMTACRFMPVTDENGTIDEQATAKMIAHLGMNARLWRYRMNMKTGEGSEECLNPDLNCEFPSCNTSFAGRRSQYAYLVDHNPKTLHWMGIRKFNTDTGESMGSWTDGPKHCWYSEPWFAPADNPQSEDHGYVITFMWNDKSKEQELQVFDAQDISAGPLARVKIPHAIPVGFHACWMKPNQIENWNDVL
ncbi:carotenoid oxygenase family protein [Hellea sp.]|nr:carotenoid oxygenase family protein [Hellea sp.]